MKKLHEMLKEVENIAGVCKHYWAIENPNGANSNGVCRKCGESRNFPNSIQEQNRGYKEKMWHDVEEKRKRAVFKALQEEFSNE